jgi:flagellar assembly protein FliH
MAQLYKGHVVDDGAYPMPPDPTAQQPAMTAGPSVNAADIQRAAAELAQMMDTVARMRPAIDNMADTLRSGAQQQGYAEGVHRAQAETQETLMQAIAALTAAQHERHAVAEQHEAALAELALRIARKVIGEHLEADPAIVSRIVQDCIADLEPTTSIDVHVHPDDLALVEHDRAELERLVHGTGDVKITADTEIARGGCRIVSPVGEVDASIETRLAVLETAFAAQRRKLADGA